MYTDTQQTEFSVQSLSPELPHPFWIGINVPIPTNKKIIKRPSPGEKRREGIHQCSSCSLFKKKEERDRLAIIPAPQTVSATALLSEPVNPLFLCAAVQCDPPSRSPSGSPTAPDLINERARATANH